MAFGESKYFLEAKNYKISNNEDVYFKTKQKYFWKSSIKLFFQINAPKSDYI